MKKLVAMLVVGLAVVAAVASSSPAAARTEPRPVTDAEVNAKIDARLHQVLTSMIAKRAAAR
jgi:hypothetical protein